MSGLHYVVVKCVPRKGSEPEVTGRNLICFPSRYEADEFFRELQVLDKKANHRALKGVVRHSCQIWTYKANDHGSLYPDVLIFGKLPKFHGTVLLLNGYAWWRADAVIIPNPVQGPDWISGGNFFIRNCRQQNLYWWVHGTHIHASENHRTKFRVQQVARGDNGEGDSKELSGPPVLIRKDAVTVSVVSETVTSAAMVGGSQFVAFRDPACNNNCLFLTSKEETWVFEDMMLNKVGVIWVDAIPKEKGQAKPLLAFMPNGGGDEWELC